MRKALFFIVCFLAMQGVYSQKIKDWQIGLGIGTANNYYKTVVTGVGMGVRLTAEGSITSWNKWRCEVGGTMAYAHTDASYRMVDPDWKSTYIWQTLLISARSNIAYSLNEKMDIYAGIHPGLRFVNFSEKYTVSPPQGYISPDIQKVRPHFGIFAGVSAKVSRSFSVFGEIGYDMIWFNVGLKYKFKTNEN